MLKRGIKFDSIHRLSYICKILKIDPKLMKYFKNYEYVPGIIMLSLYMKISYSLSYGEIEEIDGLRRIDIDHITLQRWVVQFMLALEGRFKKRKKPVNASWRMDKVYIKGKRVYLYRNRAVDKYGDIIEYLLRVKRDKRAAKAFFQKDIKSTRSLIKVNIDKNSSSISVLNSINKHLSEEEKIKIEQNKYLNNRIEGNHRFIKNELDQCLALNPLGMPLKLLQG